MAKLQVGKWQAARRKPSYTPVLQFFWRNIRMALFEAGHTLVVPVLADGCGVWISREPVKMQIYDAMKSGRWFPLLGQIPSDEAIMARHWIASAAPDPQVDREGWVLSFDAACLALGLKPDNERLWMLEKIDAAADFDTDEVWARIEYLTENPPDESEEPLFDAPRVVPALDQGCLFGAM